MKRIYLLFALLTLSLVTNAQTNYRQRQLTMDNGLLSNAVRTIVQDRRGFIWMGTDNGLCRYDGTRVVSYPLPETATSQAVVALVCDPDDNLLLGTADGVLRFTFANDPAPMVPAMADGVEACAAQGVVAQYVNRLILENVTMEGIAGERLKLEEVESVRDEQRPE